MSESISMPHTEFQKSSVDEEISQAKARVVIPIVSSFITGSIAWFDGLPILSAYHHSTSLIIGYALFGVGWLVLVSLRPSATSRRRIVVIVGDLAMITWGMVQIGEMGVIFYPLYLWVIVGNGMRFGAGYLITAIVIGQLIFSCIYSFSDYWQANFTLGLALQMGSVILPLFFLTLMRRMHRLNERLAEEAERSRAAAESKALFLANMSHELRTPMNGVLGIAQLLADTELNQRQRDLLAVIHRSGDSLLDIINDILDYSKVEAGKLSIEARPFDLRRCIGEVVQLLEHNAVEKQLSLNVVYDESSQECFVGDRNRVRQILVNLIGNALKFTERGHVSVMCHVHDSGDGAYEIEISVVDTGVGIAAENLTRIFDQFEQEDASTARRFGGTGLGLAISQKLAMSMGGSLRVESQPNQGTTFTLCLELSGAQKVEDEEADLSLVDRDYKMRALVAEDNVINQMVARGFLNKLGIEVEIAENGKDAVEKVAAHDYQMVFMDMQMPVMGGTEATQNIRELPGVRSKVPIIALSANVVGREPANSGTDSDQDLKALYSGFIGKPFVLQDLVAVIDQVVAQDTRL